MDETGELGTNFNYNYLLVQTILKMRDAQAESSPEKYWTYFEYAMGLVIPHLDFQLRADIEKDFQILNQAIQKILASNENDQTKKMKINKLKTNFADAHRFYIMQALNRVGIVKVEDEGVIDFETIDINKMTKIIRDDNSLQKSIEEAEASPPKKLDEPMVLVFHEGKFVKMPQDEYMRLKNGAKSLNVEG